MSITLVLFLFGLFGYFIINIGRVVNYLRDSVEFTVVIKDNVSNNSIHKLQKTLDVSEFVSSTFFVSKEEAAKELQEDREEDFENFLGYNPLRNTIDLGIRSNYTSKDSLESIEMKLLTYPEVFEVRYKKSLLSMINRNLTNVSIITFVISILLLLVFSTLINDIIRISLYSKRFIINTMLLVGATHQFVRRPYVRSGIMHGIIGGIVANLMLLGLFMAMRYQFKDLYNLLFEKEIAVVVGLAIFSSGLVIAWLATTISVNKFLRLNHNDLFY
ncbi:MAG: cell division protein FtsX [Bacteroidales bacterium]